MFEFADKSLVLKDLIKIAFPHMTLKSIEKRVNSEVAKAAELDDKGVKRWEKWVKNSSGGHGHDGPEFEQVVEKMKELQAQKKHQNMSLYNILKRGDKKAADVRGKYMEQLFIRAKTLLDNEGKWGDVTPPPRRPSINIPEKGHTPREYRIILPRLRHPQRGEKVYYYSKTKGCWTKATVQSVQPDGRTVTLMFPKGIIKTVSPDSLAPLDIFQRQCKAKQLRGDEGPGGGEGKLGPDQGSEPDPEEETEGIPSETAVMPKPEPEPSPEKAPEPEPEPEPEPQVAMAHQRIATPTPEKVTSALAPAPLLFREGSHSLSLSPAAEAEYAALSARHSELLQRVGDRSGRHPPPASSSPMQQSTAPSPPSGWRNRCRLCLGLGGLTGGVHKKSKRESKRKSKRTRHKKSKRTHHKKSKRTRHKRTRHKKMKKK